MLGTDELFEYLDRYDLELDSHFDGLLGRHTKKAWSRFVNAENQHLISDEALSFLTGLLRWAALSTSLTVCLFAMSADQWDCL